MQFKHYESMAWSENALCKGFSNIFYAPSIGERKEARTNRETMAKNICASCVVIDECRTYAHTHSEYGVWGGETEEDRHALGYRTPPLRNRHANTQTPILRVNLKP